MEKRYWVLYKTVQGWRLDREVGYPTRKKEFLHTYVLPYWLGEFLSWFIEGWKS